MHVPIIGQRRDRLELTQQQLQVLIEIEPLLRAAKLHLACPRCLAMGHGDRSLVGGNNHPFDPTFSVTCQCTDRIATNPRQVVAN